MTMPSQERYQGLLAALRKTTKALDRAEDDKARLDICLAAQQAVVRYLQGDPEVFDECLTRPLAFIENALHDSGRGAHVALLEHSPTQPGPPAGMVRVHVQAFLAFAVELLIVSMMGTGAATEWVASEARRLRVRCEDGAPITAQQVKRWRAEIIRDAHGKAPEGARETFTELKKLPHYAELFDGPHSTEKRPMAQAHARAAVKMLADTAPRSAPKTQAPKTRRVAASL
jgi:hypothetical protein